MPPDPDHDSMLVAVIDSNAERLSDEGRILASRYPVALFRDPGEAMAFLPTARPRVIVVDESSRGGELIGKIRRIDALRAVPLILASADLAMTAREVDADVILQRPFWPRSLLRAVSRLSNRTVEASWNDLPPGQKDALCKTVSVFTDISDTLMSGEPVDYPSLTEACGLLVEAVSRNDHRAILDGVRDHDNYTYVHSLRVATFLAMFGNAIGLTQKEVLVLSVGGLLHDIGKTAIPYSVLNKPGSLSPREWDVIKTHVPKTVDYLYRHTSLPHAVMTIAKQHHEKIDGSGYPHGLRNGKISDLARMASIVDIFGALTDRRPYKSAMSPEKALSLMYGEMASALDVHLLVTFREMLLDAADTVIVH